MLARCNSMYNYVFYVERIITIGFIHLTYDCVVSLRLNHPLRNNPQQNH